MRQKPFSYCVPSTASEYGLKALACIWEMKSSSKCCNRRDVGRGGVSVPQVDVWANSEIISFATAESIHLCSILMRMHACMFVRAISTSPFSPPPRTVLMQTLSSHRILHIYTKMQLNMHLRLVRQRYVCEMRITVAGFEWIYICMSCGTNANRRLSLFFILYLPLLSRLVVWMAGSHFTHSGDNSAIDTHTQRHSYTVCCVVCSVLTFECNHISCISCNLNEFWWVSRLKCKLPCVKIFREYCWNNIELARIKRM